MKIASLLLASAVLVSGSAFADAPAAPEAPAPPAAPAPHGDGEKGEHHATHIRRAIHDLEATIKQLREAKHDFGGHREAAIKASEEALTQLREALKFAKEEAAEHHKKK